MFQTKVVEKIKTRILCSISLFKKNYAVYEIMWENYVTARQATDDNMAHAHYMLDIQGYRHKLRICNAYYFSAETMDARTRLIVCLVNVKFRQTTSTKRRHDQDLPRYNDVLVCRTHVIASVEPTVYPFRNGSLLPLKTEKFSANRNSDIREFIIMMLLKG